VRRRVVARAKQKERGQRLQGRTRCAAKQAEENNGKKQLEERHSKKVKKEGPKEDVAGGSTGAQCFSAVVVGVPYRKSIFPSMRPTYTPSRSNGATNA